MLNRGISSLCLMIFALGLGACSSTELVQLPGHDRHALKGSIPYIGEPIEVAVKESTPSYIHFPLEVRDGYARAGAPFTLGKGSRYMAIQAKPELSSAVEHLNVMIIDGRQYDFVVRYATEEEEIDPVYYVDVSKAASQPLAQLSTNSLKYEQAISQMMKNLVAIGDGDKVQKGYGSTSDDTGTIFLASRNLRAVIDRVLSRGSLRGFVLTTENLSEASQTLTRRMFTVPGARRIKLGCKTLEPRPSKLFTENRGQHRCKVYVVLDS